MGEWRGEGHWDRLHGRAEDGENVDTGGKIFEAKKKKMIQ